MFTCLIIEAVIIATNSTIATYCIIGKSRIIGGESGYELMNDNVRKSFIMMTIDILSLGKWKNTEYC